METNQENPNEPPVLIEHIRLPDMVEMPSQYWRDLLRQKEPVNYLKPGIYDGYGRWLCALKERVPPEARVIIEFAGVTFIWGIFSQPLGAGQRGDMYFENMPGTGPVTPFFSEWNPQTGLPQVSQAIFTLIASMNGRGVARLVGRNLYSQDLPAAAGFIISQNVDIKG